MAPCSLSVPSSLDPSLIVLGQASFTGLRRVQQGTRTPPFTPTILLNNSNQEQILGSVPRITGGRIYGGHHWPIDMTHPGSAQSALEACFIVYRNNSGSRHPEHRNRYKLSLANSCAPTVYNILYYTIASRGPPNITPTTTLLASIAPPTKSSINVRRSRIVAPVFTDLFSMWKPHSLQVSGKESFSRMIAVP